MIQVQRLEETGKRPDLKTRDVAEILIPRHQDNAGRRLVQAKISDDFETGEDG